MMVPCGTCPAPREYGEHCGYCRAAEVVSVPRDLLERIDIWITRYADLYEGPPTALSQDLRYLSWQIKGAINGR